MKAALRAKAKEPSPFVPLPPSAFAKATADKAGGGGNLIRRVTQGGATGSRLPWAIFLDPLRGRNCAVLRAVGWGGLMIRITIRIRRGKRTNHLTPASPPQAAERGKGSGFKVAEGGRLV